MRFVKKWLKHEGGQSIVLVAFTIAMLCGVAALVVDTGMVSVAQGQLQNAADAAALAAANDLPSASAAATTADAYGELNGVPAANTSITTPYKGNANKVEVVCTKTVQYTFARVIGINSKVVTARAVAEKTGMTGGCFGYALFSGGTDRLGLYSDNLSITGSAHANGSIFISGNNQKVTGNLEAVTQVETYVTRLTVEGTCQAANLIIPPNSGSMRVRNRVSTAAATIDTPDFSAGVIAEAIASGTAYTTIEGQPQVFSGNGVNIDKSIYVDGEGGITIAGSSFKGQGTICAKKDIGISGNTLKSTGASVCIYSVEGGISISAKGITVKGTLYAPKGKIGIYGDNITIYGRVIAKEIIFSGTNIQIISGSGDLDFLPGGSVALCE